MGIRCTCPNGHKLHLKAFLAGKKGICPTCSARFRIPSSETATQSIGARSSAGNRSFEQDELAGDEHDIENDRIEVEIESPAERPPAKRDERTSPGSRPDDIDPFSDFADFLPQPMAKAASPDPKVKPIPPTNSESPPGGKPAPQPKPTSNAAPIPNLAPIAVPAPKPSAAAPIQPDPLTEAPDATWYVRPPAGGQYGPARCDAMRKWIAEGRISSDTYVWREGWVDWKLAGPLFPSLPVAIPAPRGPVREATTASAGPLPRKTKKTNYAFAVGLVAILTIVSIGLLVGLFYVIHNQQ